MEKDYEKEFINFFLNLKDFIICCGSFSDNIRIEENAYTGGIVRES